MEKYKSFYGILLIIIILLNFVTVCATNAGSKKSKDTDGSVDSGSSTKTSKSGDEVTPKPTDTNSAKPTEGGIPPASPSEGGNPPPSSPSASPSEGGTSPPGGGAPPSASPPEGGTSPPGGGAPPSASPPPGGGAPPSASPPEGGTSPPGGGTPSASPPVGTIPGENNATILAHVLFSITPSTTTVGRPEVKGLISLFQPPNGNTVVTGHIGALLNRANGNYKFTIQDDRGVIFYDCTGRVNPLFIGQASLFSFTWSEIKLISAIGKRFVVEESGGTLASGLIVNEFNIP